MQLSINLCNIELNFPFPWKTEWNTFVGKTFGNAENWTRDCWVRSAKAISVLCRPYLPPFLHFFVSLNWTTKWFSLKQACWPYWFAKIHLIKPICWLHSPNKFRTCIFFPDFFSPGCKKVASRRRYRFSEKQKTRFFGPKMISESGSDGPGANSMKLYDYL